MIFFKTDPTKLLLAFAFVMDKNDGRFDYRAVALALEELKEYLFIKDVKLLHKDRLLKMLDYFYERSTNKKVKKMTKNKFYKKYFKYLYKKGILKMSNSCNLNQNEIAILLFNENILIVRKPQTFDQIKELLWKLQIIKLYKH